MPRKTTRKRQKSAVAQQSTPQKTTRRDVLGRLATFGVGGCVLLGGGGALALDFRKKLAEADLERIGNGQPTIVQIHDPNCGLCQNLQKEARRALRNCEAEGIQYLVANIRSESGARFQADMGLPHVTLVLFNGSGRHLHTIEGVTPAEQIKQDMRRHFG